MKCRNNLCGATKQNEGAPAGYCSVKCANIDREGLEDEPKAMRSVATIHDVASAEPGTLAHYHAYPDKYRRRFQPERLNWGPTMLGPDLKQCGFRANRKPISGDWDFKTEKQLHEEKIAAKIAADTIDGHPEMSHVEKVDEAKELVA